MLVALRLVWRDWRGGDLTLLLIAMVLAVTIVTGISLFAERLGRAILSESSQLFGADLVLSAPRALDGQVLALADSAGVRRAHSVNFATMTFAVEGSGSDGFQIASVTAIDGHYPLRGDILLRSAAGVEHRAGAGELAAGRVWADRRLLAALELTPGQNIGVGDADLMLEQIIEREPGAGSGAMTLGPRLIMHLDDLPKTAVVQPGSRVRHRYYFAGDPARMRNWRQQLEPHLLPEHRLYSATEGRPGLNRAVERARNYLMLGAALGVTLAGGAIAIAARRYSASHVSQVAVLKTLGVGSRRLTRLYLCKIALLALVATLLGWALGGLLQGAMVALLDTGVGSSGAGVQPYLLGAFTATGCLAAFVIPPLLALREVSALAALRSDLAQPQPGLAVSAWLGVTGLAALLLWYTRDGWLSLAILGGLLLALAAVAVLAWWLIRSTGLIRFQAGNSWLLATSSLRRRGVENAMQVAVFALTLMLILVLFVIRTSVIGQWQQQIPPGLPNHFVINIAPADREPLLEWLSQRELSHADLYPVVRARLTHIDQRPLRKRVVDDSSASTPTDRQPELDRELSLTSRRESPSHNTLTEGRWWSPGGGAVSEVSVEASLAQSLGISLGSQLRFQAGSEIFAATVTSLRHVDWENMRPNFYMILHPSVLEPFPKTYMSSFYLPATDQADRASSAGLLAQLVRRFPTLTVIEIDAVIAQIQTIIARVSLAVEAILWMLMGCGGLVLIATIQAGLPDRFHQCGILRALGAPARLIRGSITIEFILLGLAAGLLAALGAELVTAIVQHKLFRTEWHWHPWIWLLGPLLGGALIGAVGALTSYRVAATPPASVLRALN